MDPSPEQVAVFGADARVRRSSAGLSASAVAERMGELLGRPIKQQSVTAWERGEYAPQDYETAAALDQVLEAGGELLALLAGDAATVNDRLQRMEDSISEIRSLILRLNARLGIASDAPPTSDESR